MEIVHGLPQPINELPTVLTIGAFDGVHLGHRHLIGAVVARARSTGLQSAAITFDPHPDTIIHPERRRLYLTSLEERIELIDSLGVDILIVLPFTRELMGQTAQEFMAHICGALALRELWIGWDFALGRKREGNVIRLRELGHGFGYTVHPVEPLLIGGEPVSSSRIRAALAAGDLPVVKPLLGRPFSVRGPVVEGDKRGRTIGFPTANIHVDELHMLPADGVYVSQARFAGQLHGAVTNVGVRPTFEGSRRTVEAYLLDFTGELYGEILQLVFLHRLRGEQRFGGISELVEQIGRDTAAARAWLQQHSAE